MAFSRFTRCECTCKVEKQTVQDNGQTCDGESSANKKNSVY